MDTVPAITNLRNDVIPKGYRMTVSFSLCSCPLFRVVLYYF